MNRARANAESDGFTENILAHYRNTIRLMANESLYRYFNTLISCLHHGVSMLLTTGFAFDSRDAPPNPVVDSR